MIDPGNAIKILCVDDESEILELYKIAIEIAGYEAIATTSPVEAVELLRKHSADIALVFTDYRMPGLTGFDFRRMTLQECSAVPFVVVSAFVTREMALNALDLKISAFLPKPIGRQDLVTAIQKYGKERTDLINECRALEVIFVDEAHGIIDEMDPILLSLDNDRSNIDSINALYRGAHTLKGSSGVLSTDVITRYIHKYEDLISGIKKNEIEFSNDVYEVLLKGFDRIRSLILAIPSKEIKQISLDSILPELDYRQPVNKPMAHSTGPKSPDSRQNNDPAKAKSRESVTVPVTMLDELSAFSGEITVIRNMLNRLVRGLEQEFTGNRDIQNLGVLLEEMHKINGGIQTRITDLRKVPLSGIFKPLPRIVRDLSKELKKNIKLTVEGETIRVDNALGVVCSNSLVHLVRNSLDHGVECPTDRTSQGKPEQGNIRIRCVEARDEIHVYVEDDGRGIDPQKIRAKALEKGLYQESELRAMCEKDVFRIIFAPGFSTASAVTDVSGRGVGTDMVKSSVESVGGSIEVESRVGLGSTFHLRLPIPKSILIINSLLVEIAGASFAVPQDAILRVVRVGGDQLASMIQNVGTGLVLRLDDGIFPLVNFHRIMKTTEHPILASNGSNQPLEKAVEILVLKSEGCFFALVVDGILDTEEIVVKSIQPCVNPVGIFAGATFMGDGSIGLILDVKGVAEAAGIETSRGQYVQTKGLSDNMIESMASNHDNYLLFQLNSASVFGIPLTQVFRLEELDETNVQYSGSERVVIYRNTTMPLYSVERLLGFGKMTENNPPRHSHPRKLPTIVTRGRHGYIGLEVSRVVDILPAEEEVSTHIRDRVGVVGNTFIRDANVTVLDLAQFVKGVETSEREQSTEKAI